MQNDQLASCSRADHADRFSSQTKNIESELKWQTCLDTTPTKLAVRQGKG